ncbi:MAG: HAD family hydrolase [Bacteroidia bacterium]|nr:HAD family hydrolase [Bacteroidia bacterium]MCO5254574.1 HAD family hydrolase [Bacteroidota bacterium]
MVILFDAANTLIHKPLLFTKVKEVLSKFGFRVEIENLRKNHKLISELIIFPDRTSKEFYMTFNKEWLNSLGIITPKAMLDAIYSACSYLPWEKFEDTDVLKELDNKYAVLSNFHGGLNSILEKHFGSLFQELLVSENEELRKPDIEFYLRAISKLKINPKEIIYIGDSIKLDLEPALLVGMNAYLIDRYNDYPYCSQRLNSLYELKELL